MPLQDFIDVRIYVDGQPLTEFPDPDGDGDEDQKMTRYVEVRAGQKFRVQVTLLPGFEFKGASHIHIKCQFDQAKLVGYFEIAYEDSETTKGGMLQVSEILDFEDSVMKDDRTGLWFSYDYEFGALGVDEDAPTSEDLSPSDAASLGSIELEVTRSKQKRLKRPFVWDGKFDQPLDRVPERSLKGKLIKNNIKYVSKEAVPAPYAAEPELFDYVPIKGKHGKPYEFNFLYRNKKILQSLGCIPRSPSPPPDPMLMLQRTEDALRMTKQKARQVEHEHKSEIMELKERLSRAEALITSGFGSNTGSRAGTVAPSIENNANAASPTHTTLPQALAGYKRKHPDTNDDEAGDNAAKRVRSETATASSAVHGLGIARAWSTVTLPKIEEDDDVLEAMPPPPKPKVVIDLTDD